MSTTVRSEIKNQRHAIGQPGYFYLAPLPEEGTLPDGDHHSGLKAEEAGFNDAGVPVPETKPPELPQGLSQPAPGFGV